MPTLTEGADTGNSSWESFSKDARRRHFNRKHRLALAWAAQRRRCLQQQPGGAAGGGVGCGQHGWLAGTGLCARQHKVLLADPRLRDVGAVAAVVLFGVKTEGKGAGKARVLTGAGPG